MRRLLAALLAIALIAGLGEGTAAAEAASAAQARKTSPCAKYKKGSKKRKACDRRQRSCTRYKKGSKKRKACVLARRKRKPAPPPAPDYSPIDYTKVQGLSQPRFGKDEIERVTVRLPMRDGAAIYLEVVKPKGATALPVVLEASPYHGTLYPRTGTRILPLPLGPDKEPLGLTGFFPPRGYAVAMMDMRGTGRSEGCLDHLGPSDQQDLEEVIEWLATQPWSNGRVGVTGHSYVGSTPIVATKRNPSGLVTIVPSAGISRMYEHQFQRGVAWNAQYLGPLEAYPQLATSADLPPQLGLLGDALGNEVGDNWGNGRPQDTLCEYRNTALNNGEGNATGHETAWHKARDASREAIAWGGTVFLVQGLNDHAVRPTAMEWFTNRGLRAGDKLWLGQWDHGIECFCPTSRGIQWTYALHAWFDRHLAQRDVVTGPPVELFVNDGATTAEAIPRRREVHGSATWPGTTRMVELGTGEGELLEGREGEPGTMSYLADPNGFTGAAPTGSATMVSAPVRDERLLVGAPKLMLHASVTGQTTDIVAKLLDRAPSGAERRLSICAMKPLLRGALDAPEPVVPGQTMALEPACWPIAHRMRPGHSLVLRVASSDDEFLPFGAYGDVTVAVGADATKVQLPVLDGAKLVPDTFPVR